MGCPLGSGSFDTANHYTAGVEQRIGETTRLKVLFFDREDGTSANESYFLNGICQFSHGYTSIGRDHSRGAQIVLQSRTANRLSGWIGYTLAYSRESILLINGLGPNWLPYFPSTEDQRHTLNLFASYRISPTLHVSGKFLFGSGFPIPNFPTNANRLGDYQRLDVRAEKDWPFSRWKLALYGEVLNVTDHNNPRYFYTSIDPKTGNPTVVMGQGLPITPTAGLAFEF